MVAFLRLRKDKNMQTRSDKGEPLLACDFTVMDTEQRRRYGALRRRLSKDLHEARELEHSYAFRHSSEAEMLIAMAEYITLELLCCPFCQEWVCRRNPEVRKPLAQVGVMTSAGGVPILVPEIVLLYKAHDLTEKYEADFRSALPDLTPSRRAWLLGALDETGPNHLWARRLPG